MDTTQKTVHCGNEGNQDRNGQQTTKKKKKKSRHSRSLLNLKRLAQSMPESTPAPQTAVTQGFGMLAL